MGQVNTNITNTVCTVVVVFSRNANLFYSCSKCSIHGRKTGHFHVLGILQGNIPRNILSGKIKLAKKTNITLSMTF